MSVYREPAFDEDGLNKRGVGSCSVGRAGASNARTAPANPFVDPAVDRFCRRMRADTPGSEEE